MIVEFFMGLGAAFSEWIAGLFGEWDIPDFLVNLDDMINEILDNLDGVAVWVDWGFILICVLAVIGVWGVGLAVKGVRAIAAHIPFFGGSG